MKDSGLLSAGSKRDGVSASLRRRQSIQEASAKHGFADGKRVDCRRQFIAALKGSNFLQLG